MKNSEAATVAGAALAPVKDNRNWTPHILVVDDDDDVRQLSVDALAAHGYGVEAVKDGAAGWQAIRSGSYDLVITDNRMPKMTGVEMIAKMRAARLPLPIIMATTYLPTHEFAIKPWLEPDAMLQRPCTNEELLETVEKVLRTDDGNDGGAAAPLWDFL